MTMIASPLAPLMPLLRLLQDPYRLWQWLQLPLWLLLLGFIWQGVGHWLQRPLAQIEINGTVQQLDTRLLEQRLWRHVEASYALEELAPIKRLLEQQEWVNRVEVQRSWPDLLQVRVREERPVARWGDRGLVNEQGRVFSPNGAISRDLPSEFAVLPQLRGPEQRSLAMMAQYRDFNQILRPLGIHLTGLQMEARGAWTLTLDSGIRLLIGRGNAIEKLRRFNKVYSELLVRYADRIVQIDARYSNGLAVTWSELPVKQQN